MYLGLKKNVILDKKKEYYYGNSISKEMVIELFKQTFKKEDKELTYDVNFPLEFDIINDYLWKIENHKLNKNKKFNAEGKNKSVKIFFQIYKIK